MVGSRSVAVARTFTSTATTTTTAPAPTSHPGSAVPISGWKRGHQSRGSVGERIQVIPGFKTSAAFLTSLGANLRIADDDLLPSPTGTPFLRPTFNFHHEYPPPNPFAAEATLDHDLSPSTSVSSEARSLFESSSPLRTSTATEECETDAALRLVADSIVEQRNIASRLLMLHPLNLTLFAIILCLFGQLAYSPEHIAKTFMTGTGLAMLVLVGVRHVTMPYADAAHGLDSQWLGGDRVIISKVGQELMGALVLRWEKGEGRGNRRKKWGKSIVRAWTVKPQFRGKGVGTELLEEAIRITERKGGEEIGFADDHANSSRFLPALYNAPMDRREMKYRAQLEDMFLMGKGRR